MNQHAGQYNLVNPNNTFPPSIIENDNCRKFHTYGLQSFYNRANSSLFDEVLGQYVIAFAFVGSNLIHKEPNSAPISIPEMIEKIQYVFGLNPTQLAKILKLSRASVYNHKQGKEFPVEKEQYLNLFQLASEISGPENKSIARGAKTILIDGMTLLDLLEEGQFDKSKILAFAKEILNKNHSIRTTQTTANERVSLYL